MELDFAMVKRTLTTFGFGAAIWFATGATPYLEAHDQYNDRAWNGNHQRWENRDQKMHQMSERQALKEHQREERRLYGNSRAIREHQREEREQLNYHQGNEKDRLHQHQYYERNGYYYDGYRYNDQNRRRYPRDYYGYWR